LGAEFLRVEDIDAGSGKKVCTQNKTQKRAIGNRLGKGGTTLNKGGHGKEGKNPHKSRGGETTRRI